MKIVQVPDPILKQKALPIDVVDDEIRQILKDMTELMYRSNGVGLAGNQVGLLKRLVVIDISEEKNNPICLCNPEFIEKSEEMISFNEGCLSIPRQYADVIRHQRVVVRYIDENNQVQTIEAEDFLAVALQHEIDHLDGILFIDHLSKFKRNYLLKKHEKRRKNEECEG